MPRSRLVVVTGPNGFLALADADRGRVLKRVPDHVGDVLPPAISADGRLLVTASEDQTVRLWSLPDMRPVGARLRFGGDAAIERCSDQPGRTPADDRAARPERRERDTRGLGRRQPPSRRPPRRPRHTHGCALQPRRPAPGRRLPQRPVAAVVDRRTGSLPRASSGATPARSTPWRSAVTAARSRPAAWTATVRLWDIETQQAIGTPLPGPGRGLGAVAPYFTPTAQRSSPATTPAAPTAGTSVPSRSHATPARSPAGASHAPNGPSSYPAATTTRPAKRPGQWPARLPDGFVVSTRTGCAMPSAHSS